MQRLSDIFPGILGRHQLVVKVVGDRDVGAVFVADLSAHAVEIIGRRVLLVHGLHFRG